MARFYNVKGDEISREEFIDLYSGIYYFLNDIRVEKYIEEMMLDVNKTIDADNLISFLRWKVGDKGNGDHIVTQYGSKIEIEPLRKLAKEIDNSWSEKTADVLYQSIINRKIRNLGSVYSLALVSLITKGREPIYDKFAEIAIDVIIGEKDFREPQKYIELANKENIKDVLKRYEVYKAEIKYNIRRCVEK